MQSPPSNSVESLRHRSEQSRARLEETVSQLKQAVAETGDELKTTLSPHHLRQEVRAYARETQKSAARAVRENVTKHPLEALAIGAVVAYPLLGIVRNIPIPLALIGAGLFLSRRRNHSTPETASRSGGVGPAIDAGGERGESGTTGLREAPGSIASAGARAAETLADLATSAVSGVRSKTEDIAARATTMSQESSETLTRLAQRNPLLVGGVAMAIGSFIAASIPSFRIEDQVLGKGGEALKDTARQAADGVVRGARAEAAKFTQNVTSAVHAAGLTTETVDRTVDALADKVASVVDRGVDAAIGAEARIAETEDSSDGDQNARL